MTCLQNLVTTASLFIVLLSGVSARADLAQDLLKASDRARGGLEKGLEWESEVTTVEEGETSVRRFRVRAREVDAHVEALQPSRNKGEIYLFNDRTMWFFKPALRKPVAISARQKLTGQAAIGDIASTHYARDYSPTLEKTETLDGQKVYVLMLKAKANNLTYDQIRYWIRDRDRLAIKAEFLTLQGQPFKRATLDYQNKVSVEGKSYDFISSMEIVDAQFENHRSTIRYVNPRVQDHSSSLFNVNNLKR